MRERAAALGVVLRPHVKTHKCPEAARVQLGGGTGPITVSTLDEARGFARKGFDDITYAVPIALARIPEAFELVRSGLRLGVLVDHPKAVEVLARRAAETAVDLRVWIKVDCGAHRAGVDPESAAGVEVARAIADAPRLDLAGILTHAGHAYACRTRAEIAVVAEQERDVMVAFASRLRAEGLAVDAVSIGSTPTASVVEDLAGVTEIRPGNYLFFDGFQTAIGACELSDCAFTIVTSVIGLVPEAGRLLVDAGALALSKDAGPVHVHPQCGFGVVTELDGTPLPGLRLASLSQEHGVVRGAPELLRRRTLGERLRIVPNHSCLAAACFDRYLVADGPTVVDEWHVVAPARRREPLG